MGQGGTSTGYNRSCPDKFSHFRGGDLVQVILLTGNRGNDFAVDLGFYFGRHWGLTFVYGVLEFGGEGFEFGEGREVLFIGWDDGDEQMVILESAFHGVIDVVPGLARALEVVSGEFEGFD